MVYSSQEGYYKAIEQSSARSDCSPFIDFMLGEILQTLQQSVKGAQAPSDKEQFILHCIRENAAVSAREMAERAGVSPRQIEKYLTAMKKKGILQREGARKSGRWKLLLPHE